MSEISRSIGSFSSRAIAVAAVLGQQHVVALALQHDRQQFPHRPLIVDHENPGAPPIGGQRGRLGIGLTHVVTSALAGSRTDTVVPSPRRELTWISPL